MRKLAIALVGALAAAIAVSAPAVASGSRPLYPVTTDLHFADAKGRVHTLVVPMFGEPTALEPCPPLNEVAAKAIAAQRNPELYVMTYLGSTCHGAKFASHVDVQPTPPDSRPAVVVLFYAGSDRKYHYAMFGNDRPGDYIVGTCPLVLKQTKATLIKQAASTHIDQRFLDASCLPLNTSTLLHFANN
jgi:hypothetical protein